MGLIYPQAVKIHPSGNNFRVYESKGYVIPMKSAPYFKDTNALVIDKDASLIIAIDDLLPSSGAYVWYNCDCCGEINYMTYNDYNRRHTNPYRPLYCRKCSLTTMNSGPLSPSWNSNLTQEERENKRKYPEYTKFIKRVLARDNYTCQCCGKKSEADMEVHHLNGYNWDIEHRTDDTNGIALCIDCHKNFHSLYGKGYNTKEQFEEWIGRRIELTEYFGEIYSLPKIYCIEDNIIYNDKYDAANQLNCRPDSILRVCYGDCYTFHSKHYVYYDKYLQMSQDEINELLKKGKLSYKDDRQVICLNTGILYKGSTYAAKAMGYKNPSIVNSCCNGIIKQGRIKTTAKIKWIWHRDFIKFPPHEQLQIALDNKETLQEGSFLYELLYGNNENNNDEKEHLSSPTPQTLLQPSAQ